MLWMHSGLDEQLHSLQTLVPDGHRLSTDNTIIVTVEEFLTFPLTNIVNTVKLQSFWPSFYTKMSHKIWIQRQNWADSIMN